MRLTEKTMQQLLSVAGIGRNSVCHVFKSRFAKTMRIMIELDESILSSFKR